jgi:hypothetical protein
VTPGTSRVWLVAYLPEEVVSAEDAAAKLRELIELAPVVRALRLCRAPALGS